MTDTHCHLSFAQYDADRDAVVDRAGAVGVRRLVNPGTDLAQSRAAVELVEKYENGGPTPGVTAPTPGVAVWAAVGVHPQDVGGLTDEVFAEIAKLARHPRVVAIGEVGLELHHRAGALTPQTEWLERFVTLAREVGKPLIFHVRNAHAEFRRFLERRTAADPRRSLPRSDSSFRGNDMGDDREEKRVRGVIHAFSGTADDARFYTEQGLFLGVTGVVTFPNAQNLRTVVQEVPLECLLLETDAPFLAPQSHRGKRNEPAYLSEVAESVAALKGVSREEVERTTDENATGLFTAIRHMASWVKPPGWTTR